MKLMISHAHTSGLLTLFLLTDAVEEVPSLGTSNRDLKTDTNGAIALLEPGKRAHAVRISQTFVGDFADGCDENYNGSNARIMFATFMDPDTLQEKCGIFQRNVSPCFQETIVVGCDLETNTATINIYVVDESFEKGMTTDNPKMGRCKAGQGDIIKRAIKVTETFDCPPLTEEEKSMIRFNTCSASSDYCAEGTFCLFSTSNGYRCISGQPGPDCSCQEDEECFYSKQLKGYSCRPFAQLGDPCGGVEVSEISHTCDLKSSFCYLRDSCYNLQQAGNCVAFSGDLQCSSDDDCEKSTDFCDVSIGRCKPKLKKDDCCDSDNRCSDGLTCVTREFDNARHALCHTECNVQEGGSSCSENEWCSYYVGYYDYSPSEFCKPYQLKGDKCDFFTYTSIFLEACNPETLYCFVPYGDYYYQKKGICWTPGKPCRVDSTCELAEEWCDMTEGLCRPRLPEAFYCDPNIKNQCQEGLECKDVGGWRCRLYDNTCSGQLCGGITGIKCDCLCENNGTAPICMDSYFDPNGYYDECNPVEGDPNCAGFCFCLEE